MILYASVVRTSWSFPYPVVPLEVLFLVCSFCFMHCETHHVFCYKELCLQCICLTTLGHLAGRVPRGQGRMNLQKRKQQPCSTNWWKALVFGAKEGQKKYGTPFLMSLAEILLKIFPRGTNCMEQTDAVCFYRSYRNTLSVPNYRPFCFSKNIIFAMHLDIHHV